MKLVPIDKKKFTEAGITFEAGKPFASLTFNVEAMKEPVKVSVQVNGDSLAFLPERSHLHRLVLAKLAIPL